MLPQTLIEPSAFSAAKAKPVEKTCVKPVPVGALVPPELVLPQTLIEPSAFSAAKAVKLLTDWPDPARSAAPPLPTLWLGNITPSGSLTSSVYTWATEPTALVLVMVNDLLPAVVGVPDK